MSLGAYGDPVAPPRAVAGDPSRLMPCEVVTVNSDGTVDVRNLASRATKSSVPVLCGYAPTIGDRVVVGDLNGDSNTPAIIAVLSCAKRSYCFVRKTATQTLTNNQFVAVTFDVEDADPDGMHAANSSQVILNKAGIWMVYGAADLSTPAGSTHTTRLSLGMNGTPTLTDGQSPVLNAAGSPSFMAAWPFICTQPGTDYVEVFGWTNGGTGSIVGGRLVAMFDRPL